MMEKEFTNKEEFYTKYEIETILKGHTSQVTPLLLLDDTTLVSGCNDNIIKIWDLNKNECVATLKGHRGPINDIIKLDSKHKMIVSCSHDSSIRFWDLNSFSLSYSIEHAQGGQIYAICEIKNKNILLSCSVDTTIKAFHINTYQSLFILKSPYVNSALICLTQIIFNLGIYKESDIVASGTFDGHVILWNLSSKQISSTLHCGFAAMTSVKQLPTQRTKMLTTSYKKYIRVWNILTFELLTEIQFHPYINWLLCSTLINDETLIVGSGSKGMIAFNIGDTPGFMYEINDDSCIYSLTRDSKGRIIAGTSDNLIKIYKPSLQ